MEVKARTIEIYEKADGSCPYLEWRDGLKDISIQARIDVRFARIRQGNFGDCKNLNDGVYELRFDVGPGYRIYFGHDNLSVVVLLGGSKKGQQADIEDAKQFWRDYKS